MPWSSCPREVLRVPSQAFESQVHLSKISILLQRKQGSSETTDRPSCVHRAAWLFTKGTGLRLLQGSSGGAGVAFVRCLRMKPGWGLSW